MKRDYESPDFIHDESDSEPPSKNSKPDYAATGRVIETDIIPRLARLELTGKDTDRHFRLRLRNSRNLSLHLTFGRAFQKIFRVPFYNETPTEPSPSPDLLRAKYRSPPADRFFSGDVTYIKHQPSLGERSRQYARIAADLDLTHPAHQATFRSLVESLEGGSKLHRQAARKRADIYIDRAINPDKYRR